MEPVVLPNRAILFSGPGMRPFSALTFSMSSICPFSFLSPIGYQAMKEWHAVRDSFRSRANTPECSPPTPQSLQDIKLVQAQMAAVYAVALIRERISDREFQAARANIDAVLELMTDGFVNAWGPRFSRRGRARRARALAHQAALDFEAAQGAAMAAVLLQPVAVDNPGGWGTGGGWGDVGTWGAAPSAPALWAAPLGNTWGWGGGANGGWAALGVRLKRIFYPGRRGCAQPPCFPGPHCVFFPATPWIASSSGSAAVRTANRERSVVGTGAGRTTMGPRVLDCTLAMDNNNNDFYSPQKRPKNYKERMTFISI
ncbi:hypothetical protein B0H13DRAFT_2369753 [Mycena leptocephala]|nr:hypothetical protein B0H13DRAFT_2369753 [Mycena leptocephala]